MGLTIGITGATGMIGKGVLLEALDDERIDKVICIGRRPVEDVQHPKKEDVILEDFLHPENISDKLKEIDAMCYCMGISSNGISEADYKRLTYDYALAFGKEMSNLRPDSTFNFISGQGTNADSNIAWARIKGESENDLLKLKFKGAYMFRPGVIQPLRGIKSRTKLYARMYVIMRPFWFIIKPMMGDSLTTTTSIGKAMINAADFGYDKTILEAADITKLSKQTN